MYELILKQPKKDEVILATGNEDYCEAKRLELSTKYNSKHLSVVEVIESENITTTDEYNVSLSDVISYGFLKVINWFFDKEDKE